MVVVYRYEYPNGGGSYFYRDGTPHMNDLNTKISLSRWDDSENEILYGYDSKLKLTLYAVDNKFPIEEMRIKQYIVNNSDIIQHRISNGYVQFKYRPKEYLDE